MTKKYLLLALIFHVITAWFSVGRFHADEQFQIIEFIGYKLGLNNAIQMPWEFHEKMRPAIQPFFGYYFLQVFPFITSPFIQAFLLRLFSSLLGLYSLYQLTKFYKTLLSENNYLLLVQLTFIYCFLPYFHARYSSENISSSLLILGTTSFLNKKNLFIVGIFLGLAIIVRIQTLFLVGGLLLWILLINKTKPFSFTKILGGIFFSFLIGILTDRWFYGEWVNTTWNYIYQNIVLKKSSDFGTEPVWYYIEKISLDAVPPFSILIITSFLLLFYFKPKHHLTWMFIPFLSIHFLIAHKELRFLFPLLNFIPLVFILSVETIKEKKLQILTRLLDLKLLKYLFLISNVSILLYLSFKPADDYTPSLKFIYNNYNPYKTTLLYLQNNPYDEAIALNFYKSNNVHSQKFNESSLPVSNNKLILAINDSSEMKKINKLGYSDSLVYSSIPEFLYLLNFNNWIERTNHINIYELKRKQ